MIIYPAIDILKGKCVRLTKGDFNAQKIYNNDPLKVAQNFIKSGSQYLHIIDLDGAKAGYPVNQELILKIASTFNIKIQVGGGIRTFQDAQNYLENDVDRIIISSAAMEDQGLIKKLLKKYDSNAVTVSVDINNSQIATRGWEVLSKKSIYQFLQELEDLGIKNLIVTDITKDGTLTGPNLTLLEALKATNFKITAAGGIKNLKDLRDLKNLGLSGAIIGKALYENKIDLKKALQISANQLTKRIISCLDIANNRIVKGTFFKNLKDAGDPVKMAKYYYENGADELVFLDITASRQNRKTLINLAKKVAENISIPFTIGGGIKTIEEIREILKSGADKISLGTAAVKNPNLIKEASQKFGSQAIVISLDCLKNSAGWEIYIKGGYEPTGIDVKEFAKKMEILGAGELLINSLDRDGTNKGYDLELLKAVSEIVNIPIIASSGAGSKEDFFKAFSAGGCDAALAASIFHYKKLTIPEVKKYLISKNIAVRA